MARDRTRPYTYSAGMSDFKSLLGRVSEDTNFGHHGLRVEGYNLSVDGNGEDVTVAHGLWKSTAHTRYARFTMRQVCARRDVFLWAVAAVPRCGLRGA